MCIVSFMPKLYVWPIPGALGNTVAQKEQELLDKRDSGDLNVLNIIGLGLLFVALVLCNSIINRMVLVYIPWLLYNAF